MARYIDAELLEKTILKPSIFDINRDDVIAIIAEIPTANVVPKSELDRVYYNLQAVLEESSICGTWDTQTPYCPHCGAKLT